MTEQLNGQPMISWGIIGCGNVTELKSGPAFNKVPQSTLRAVMRRDAARAADYAARHQVPFWYSDAAALINDPAINAIYVATPPKFHEEYAVAAMENGKAVYVEKPVTLSVASCTRMADAVKANDGKLVVAHYRRGLPMFLKIKDLVETGAVGKIKNIRLTMFQTHRPDIVATGAFNWRVDPTFAGAGYFYDLAPHQLDIIQFIFGESLRKAGVAAHQTDFYAAEDAVSGIMELPNNILFQGDWNFSMPEILKEDSCLIIGEKGYLKFPFFGTELRIVTEAGADLISFEHPQNIQHPMISKVVDYFLGKSSNPCSIEEAMKSMEVMERFAHGR
jgi:predicted dehydrogenase